MRAQPTIREFMTPSPHSIAADRTLAEAHEMMRKFQIRHLPVIEAGTLVGIVSERDLHLVETFKDVDPTEVQVDEAMSPDPYVVSPKTKLQQVATTMWKKKYGSAVVMEGRDVAGVFTTIDALAALVTHLAREGAPKRAAKAPARTTKRPVRTAKGPARRPRAHA